MPLIRAYMQLSECCAESMLGKLARSAELRASVGMPWNACWHTQLRRGLRRLNLVRLLRDRLISLIVTGSHIASTGTGKFAVGFCT